MKVDLYTICLNEQAMLPFFLRHYERIVDRFVVFDDGSTDASLEILERSGAKIRSFPRAFSDSFVDSERALFDTCWKESRGAADWVVVVNLDEHLYHRSLRRYLGWCKERNVTAVRSVGYQMVADAFPEDRGLLYEQVVLGVRWEMMDKLTIFDPDAVEDTFFKPGRHDADPTGDVRYPEEREVLLLHYKYLGFDYLFQRLTSLRTGFGERDIAMNWGHKYRWTREEARRDFDDVLARARPVPALSSLRE